MIQSFQFDELILRRDSVLRNFHIALNSNGCTLDGIITRSQCPVDGSYLTRTYFTRQIFQKRKLIIILSSLLHWVDELNDFALLFSTSGNQLQNSSILLLFFFFKARAKIVPHKSLANSKFSNGFFLTKKQTKNKTA